jgi:hypothetical protein
MEKVQIVFILTDFKCMQLAIFRMRFLRIYHCVIETAVLLGFYRESAASNLFKLGLKLS